MDSAGANSACDATLTQSQAHAPKQVKFPTASTPWPLPHARSLVTMQSTHLAASVARPPVTCSRERSPHPAHPWPGRQSHADVSKQLSCPSTSLAFPPSTCSLLPATCTIACMCCDFDDDRACLLLPSMQKYAWAQSQGQASDVARDLQVGDSLAPRRASSILRA